jgi:hypothetical protein
MLGALYEQDDHRSYPANVRAQWKRKHSWACSYCGGHNGMLRRWLDFMPNPPRPREWFRLEGVDDAIYTFCPCCGEDVPDGYISISHEEALAMWQEIKEITDD